MPEIDPILSKMMFQKFLRGFLFLVGLAVLLAGAGLVLTRQLLSGVFVLLVGLGLMVLPLTGIFKEAIEID